MIRSVALCLLAVSPLFAQQPPTDAPTVKVGGTIFADYTYVESPQPATSAFNVTRAYINVTGNIVHRVSYRITPDIVRETGSGSSLTGSYTFRLKYAYGQFNLDDWTTKGSWLRFGLQQTPWIDYEEGIYRYRFQGASFADREGFLTSSDYALSGRWMFPGDYGDVHAGFYNGEGYNRAEVNNEKAFQVRAALRPFPRGGELLKGLRIAGFVDSDHYSADAKRQRLIGAITYEHPAVNAGIEYLDANDRDVHARGFTAFATPKLPHNFEILLRHDELKPDKDTDRKRKRNIAGIAYWMPARSGITSALLVDYDSVQQSGYSPERPDDTRYGLKLLINF